MRTDATSDFDAANNIGGGRLIIETSTIELEKDFMDQHAVAKTGKHVLRAVTDTGTGMLNDDRQKNF